MKDTEEIHNDSLYQMYTDHSGYNDSLYQTNTDHSGHTADEVENFVTLYIEGFALFSGLLGNALVFVVFGRKNYYNKSIHVYIRSLSVFNFIILIGPLMTHWLNYNFFPERKHPNICALFLTIGRICVDCDAWVIAAMSFNQYVAVLHPHNFKTLCSLNHSRLTVLVMAILAMLKNAYNIKTAGFVEHRDGKKVCVVVSNSSNGSTLAYQWTDVFVACVLPFVCMTFLNVRVALRLGTKRKHEAKVRQLITMLSVVSIIFIVASLCKKISAIVLTHTLHQAGYNMSYLTLTISFARVVWCTANAANMWVYLALCPQFRADILRAVCPVWKSPAIEPSSSGQHVLALS